MKEQKDGTEGTIWRTALCNRDVMKEGTDQREDVMKEGTDQREDVMKQEKDETQTLSREDKHYGNDSSIEKTITFIIEFFSTLLLKSFTFIARSPFQHFPNADYPAQGGFIYSMTFLIDLLNGAAGASPHCAVASSVNSLPKSKPYWQANDSLRPPHLGVGLPSGTSRR